MLILFLPPPHTVVKTWIHRPTGIVRERSHMVGKEEERKRKKPRKKPLRRDRDLNPRTLSPEPSMLTIRPRHPALLLIPNLSTKLVRVCLRVSFIEPYPNNISFQISIQRSSPSHILTWKYIEAYWFNPTLQNSNTATLMDRLKHVRKCLFSSTDCVLKF